jgi:hypothetical protein
MRNLVICFITGLVLGVFGAGIAGHIMGNTEVGELDGAAGEYRASEQRTAEQIAGLERTIGDQRERIDYLTASNNRLESNIRSARGICNEALRGSEKTTGDIRSAIELSKTLTIALKNLDRILNSGNSGNGVDNVEDL